ncbi:MAG: iron ABC transporter permease [Tannerellaceae bacterium]|nr:iron ABC transporter permease [Tannerellaceae bacterium]
MRASLLLTLLSVALPVLFVGSLTYGAVSIPPGSVLDILLGGEPERMTWRNIILQSRLPQAVVATLAGASLAVAGLLLQTLFRNPLAGPSVLGVSDGANLGVAVVMLSSGGSLGRFDVLAGGGYAAVIAAAFAGACAILCIILYMSSKVRNNVMLLIVGIMVGYLASSVISILNFYATADRVYTFVAWGLGSFSGVSLERLPLFASCTLVALSAAVLLIKPLNALLLGEMYASNLGVRVRRVRAYILLSAGALTAVTTAFCGPVAFIGLAVPHIARLSLGTSNHKSLLPATLLTGACVALACNMLMVVPGANVVLPLNAVTPMIGAPVIIYVIMNRRSIQYFN